MPPLFRSQGEPYDSSDDEDEGDGVMITAPPRPAAPLPRRPPILFKAPRMCTQTALNALTVKVWNDHRPAFVPNTLRVEQGIHTMPDIEHFCAPVVHPRTGEVITKYAKLAQDPDPDVRETWKDGLGKEFGNMAQGDDKTGTPGMDAIHVLDHEQIKKIPTKRR